MISPEVSGHLGSSMIDQNGRFNQERDGLKKEKKKTGSQGTGHKKGELCVYLFYQEQNQTSKENGYTELQKSETDSVHKVRSADKETGWC